MPQGTVLPFNISKKHTGDGTFDLDSDTFKVALVSNSSIVATQADLALATGFTEVTGTGYTAGGIILPMTWVEATGTVTLDSTTNPVWAQNAAGPVDIRYGIIYSDTDPSDTALAFVDLTQGGDGTTPVSMIAGTISITWNDNGILTLT